MRLTLIDLLIVMFLFYLGSGPALLLRHSHPEACLLGVPVGLVLVLIGGSWIYRRWGIMPMLLPRCPHCFARQRFQPADNFGDRWRMVCADCKGAFVYWTSRPPREYRPGPLAEVQVGFPYLLGPTRKTWSGAATITRPPELTGRTCSAELRSTRGLLPVDKIASAIVGPAERVRTEDEVTINSANARVRIRPEAVHIDIDESDCAVTNALTMLQCRGWLEALRQNFSPLQIRLDERWLDLEKFLVFGD